MRTSNQVDRNRKIVFIIGNGFDLNLGRRTSYKDFWESEFCPKGYPAPIIKHLNEKWPDGLDGVKWYDMENELLNFYKGIEQSRRYPDVITREEKKFLESFRTDLPVAGYYQQYSDQIQSLYQKGLLDADPLSHTYITIPYRDDMLQDSVLRDRKAISLIKHGLVEYLKSISQSLIPEGRFAIPILFALTESVEAGNTIDIYNFNYTELPQGKWNDLEGHIHYVHGRAKDDNIIIGTKDYENFGPQYDFLQKSFDPHFAPPAVVYDMLDADDVVIFGHSLGVNDSQYFKAFFKQQSSPVNPKRKKITIFTWDDQSEIGIKRSLQQMTDYNLSSLASLNDFKIIKISTLSHNAPLFKSFLSRYIKDDRLIRAQIGNIKEEQ